MAKKNKAKPDREVTSLILEVWEAMKQDFDSSKEAAPIMLASMKEAAEEIEKAAKESEE